MRHEVVCIMNPVLDIIVTLALFAFLVGAAAVTAKTYKLAALLLAALRRRRRVSTSQAGAANRRRIFGHPPHREANA